jgi:hypothetical protein
MAGAGRLPSLLVVATATARSLGLPLDIIHNYAYTIHAVPLLH